MNNIIRFPEQVRTYQVIQDISEENYKKASRHDFVRGITFIQKLKRSEVFQPDVEKNYDTEVWIDNAISNFYFVIEETPDGKIRTKTNWHTFISSDNVAMFVDFVNTLLGKPLLDVNNGALEVNKSLLSDNKSLAINQATSSSVADITMRMHKKDAKITEEEL